MSNSKTWNGFTFNADRSLSLPSGAVLTADDMQKLADSYKGANRIYKPFPILFWQDCKNGKASNWIEEVAV